MNQADTQEPGESERAQAQISRMDALLAEGRAAMARMDELYQAHGIQPGTGARVLLGDDVPERHRIIFARLLADLERMDQRINELDPRNAAPAPVAVGARAVGNRYRI